jgi:hypothetical protein
MSSFLFFLLSIEHDGRDTPAKQGYYTKPHPLAQGEFSAKEIA